VNKRRIRAIGAALLLVAAVVGLWVWFEPLPTTQPDPAPVSDRDSPVRAESLARDAIRGNPTDSAAHLQLARALRRQGRSGEAQATLTRAMQLGLPELEGRREYTLLLATQDWPIKAEGIFQRALRDYPDDKEVLLAVAGAYAAKSFWAMAERVYSKLLEQDPEEPELLFHRGEIRMRMEKHDLAANDFRQVLRHQPDRFEARLYLGNSLLGDARMAEAEKELLACRRLRPDLIEPLIGLAKCSVERGDLDATEKLLDEAATIDATSLLVLQDQAALYLRQQKGERAIAILNRLIAIDPNNRQGHLQLAQALLAAGNVEEARLHERIYQELDRREEERLAARRGMQ
jgi:tetratricopeptide (TPR) repeat protein